MNRLTTRWLLFAGLAVVVVVSYLVNVDLTTTVSARIDKAYRYLEELPEGTVIMVSFDHEASSLPEVRPLALVLLRHAFRNDLRIIGLALYAEGTSIGYQILAETAAEYDKVYGRDYVFLGFRPQHIATILGLGESIIKVFPEDYLAHRCDTLPLLSEVMNYEEIDLVVSIADSDRPTQWVEYAGARYNQRIMAGLTAAMITSHDPYVSSGQLYSVIGGLKGAAEYENLYGVKGGGNRGMLAQSNAHLYIVALIILGNIVYFSAGRRKGGR